MTPQTTPKKVEPKLSGYAWTTEKLAVHITAIVAGEERHYILPSRQFDQFVAGQNVTGVNRDELSLKHEEECFTVRCLWECGIPYLHDTLNDPLGEYRIQFPIDGLADLFTMNRTITFLKGREGLKSSKRVEEEITRQVWIETYMGYTPVSRIMAEA